MAIPLKGGLNLIGLAALEPMPLDGSLNLVGLAALALGWFVYRIQDFRLPLDFWWLVTGCVVGTGISMYAKEKKQPVLNGLHLGIIALFYLPIVVRAIHRRVRKPEVAVWVFAGNRNLAVRVYQLEPLSGSRAKMFWSVQIYAGLLLICGSSISGIMALMRHA